MKRNIAVLTLSLGLSLGLASCNLSRQQGQQTANSVGSSSSNQTATTSPSAVRVNPASTGNAATGNPATGNPATSNTGRPAYLVGVRPPTRISVRSGPSLRDPRRYYGRVGARVNVLRQSRGGDGSTWYYVQFPRSGAAGWVHRNLVSFAGPPSIPTAPAGSTPPGAGSGEPTSLSAALDRCRNFAASELPNTTIRLSRGRLDQQGNAIIQWSSNTAAYGECTVDRNGRVISFVSNNKTQPNRPPVNSVALQACRQRTADEFPDTPLANIQVAQTAVRSDGTYDFSWRAAATRGTCRSDRNGNIIAFNRSNPSSAVELALNRCKARAERDFPNTRVLVSRDPNYQGTGYQVLWSTDGGASGTCQTDNNGTITTFTNNSNTGGNPAVISCTGTILGRSFTAYSNETGFSRVEFRDTATNARTTATLSFAGTNGDNQPFFRGQVGEQPLDEVTVVHLAPTRRPAPGSEISLAYNGNWTRGTCR